MLAKTENRQLESQQQPGGAPVKRSGSRLVRLLTSTKRNTSPNDKPASSPSKRPLPASNAFSKEHREAALRERGLLPPLPQKDLSQLEREQDSKIPAVSLPTLGETPDDVEGGSGMSAADLVKKEWEARNKDGEATQRERLQTFKFGGASTSGTPASIGSRALGLAEDSTSDPASFAQQGSNLPNEDKPGPQPSKAQLDDHQVKGLSPQSSSTNEEPLGTQLPLLPSIPGLLSSDIDQFHADLAASSLFSDLTTLSPPIQSCENNTSLTQTPLVQYALTSSVEPPTINPLPRSSSLPSSPLLPESLGLPEPLVSPIVPDASSKIGLISAQSNMTGNVSITDSSSSIPPSLDSTSRTLSTSSEESSSPPCPLPVLLTSASGDFKDVTSESLLSITGSSGKSKGPPTPLRVILEGMTPDIPVIIEGGEDGDDANNGSACVKDQVHTAEPLDIAAVVSTAERQEEGPKLESEQDQREEEEGKAKPLTQSQHTPADRVDITRGSDKGGPQTQTQASQPTQDHEDNVPPPSVPLRDREHAKANGRATPQPDSPASSPQPKPSSPSRKEGMTVDASVTSRKPSSDKESTPAAPPMRRKTINPFKKRQKDRAVTPDPLGKEGAATSPTKSTFGKIGRSVVGSVLRPSRQQSSVPPSPRSPFLQASSAGMDGLPSQDQNSNFPPMPLTLPVPGSSSHSPPSSPSKRAMAYGMLMGSSSVFQQQQLQPPVKEDAVVRQAVSPTLYNSGSILAEASAIKDDEQRRMTEMAFLY